MGTESIACFYYFQSLWETIAYLHSYSTSVAGCRPLGVTRRQSSYILDSELNYRGTVPAYFLQMWRHMHVYQIEEKNITNSVWANSCIFLRVIILLNWNYLRSLIASAMQNVSTYLINEEQYWNYFPYKNSSNIYYIFFMKHHKVGIFKSFKVRVQYTTFRIVVFIF